MQGSETVVLRITQSVTRLRQVSRILWVRVALIAALSVLATMAAPLFDPLIPAALKSRITEDAVLPILSILASSMLAVATFSLGVMVSSHRTLAGSTTPRIHRLLMDDTSTQSMLATFIGAFVFALFSIILFRAEYYGEEAAVIIFLATIFVVSAIVVSLIRWIDKLSRIGSVEYALERAEETARETMREFRSNPTFGASILRSEDDIPDSGTIVRAKSSGFLRTIDFSKISQQAENTDATVFILKLPGDRVLKGQEIARIVGSGDASEVACAFAIGSSRSHEQDPRYALQALRETASRALSPGINDPGTAVEVITRLEILWHDFFASDDPKPPRQAPGVFVRPLQTEDLIEISFSDIARDGAGFLEVLRAISLALETIDQSNVSGVEQKVKDLRDQLQQFAENALHTEHEKNALANLPG